MPSSSFNPPLASRPRETSQRGRANRCMECVSIRPWPHDQGKQLIELLKVVPQEFQSALGLTTKGNWRSGPAKGVLQVSIRPWPHDQGKLGCVLLQHRGHGFNPPLASRPRETTRTLLCAGGSWFQSALGLTTKGNPTLGTSLGKPPMVSIRPWPHDQGKLPERGLVLQRQGFNPPLASRPRETEYHMSVTVREIKFQSALGLTTKGNARGDHHCDRRRGCFNPPLASRPRETPARRPRIAGVDRVSIRPWPHDQGKRRG